MPIADIAPDPEPVSVLRMVPILGLVVLVAVAVPVVVLIRRRR